MKKIITLLAFFFVLSTYGQTAMSRTIDVKEGQMDKFIQMAGKKTKMYNGSDADTQFYTWRILTGPNAGKIWRVEVGESLASFDTDPYSSSGGKYWQKNVAPTIANNNVTRTVTWQRAEGASWSPDSPTNDLMRRAIFYTYKESHEQDFWRYRTRLVKALKAAEWPQRVSTLNCASGCDGNWVQVRYHHKNFTGEASDNSNFSQVVEKYNEMYGEDSYEDDSQKLQMSVIENRTRHHQRLPELSSPWN